MEGSNRITKGQLLEMVRKEIAFQDKKELLESKISSINDELYVLTEGREGKKEKEDEIDEGLFQNIGRGIAGAFSGAKGVGQTAVQKVQQTGQAAVQKVQQTGQAVAQKYQSGSDQKKLQYIKSDIQKKEAELAYSKKQYQNLTGKAYNAKTASKVIAAPRGQQGIVKKAPAKKTSKTNTATSKTTPTTAYQTTSVQPGNVTNPNKPAQPQNPNKYQSSALKKLGENKKK